MYLSASIVYNISASTVYLIVNYSLHALCFLITADMQGCLEILREMLGAEQRSSLFRFLDALTQLYSEKHDKLKLSELRVELNVALALMERDFPVSIQVFLLSLW